MHNSINRQNLLIILGLFSLTGIIAGSLIVIGYLTISLILILFVLLSSYFVLQSRKNIFEPFTVFSFYFFSVVIASYHLYFTNFENNAFIKSQSFSIHLSDLLSDSLIYVIVSYIFAYLGYISFKKKAEIHINLNQDGISLKIVGFFTVIFAFFGISNFILNIYSFAGGNPLIYFSNVSARHLEWQTGGTTLFYLFSYMAGYLWLYRILRQREKISVSFYSFVILTIFMKSTTGRIFSTLAYAMSYVVIYYYANVNHKRESGWYLVAFVFVAFVGLTFYFFRITSSLNYSNQLSASYLTTILTFFDFNSIMYLAVDKGNLPNMAVLMKILEGWGRDIPFLCGESLFTWIFGILPSFCRPEGYQPSVMIKQIWYSHIPGGNLPPTGMGEMFVNFGYIGAVFGMYLFGMFCAFVNNLLLRFNNFWYLIIYSNITLGFIMIYPKGEFDNLSLWQVLPSLFVYLLLFCFTKLARVSNYHLETTSPTNL